jgi:S-sulfosulfanyl-L-cysteine sulfohydrolase
VAVKNPGGTTLVTNAGCNGKFLAVLDLNVKNKHVVGYQYRLLPVFSDMLQADKPMSELITKLRAPYEPQLSETLAVSDALLYRRGNFNGTFDQIILDALMNETAAEIAFSPGFRWGTSVLPNETITFEQVMNQTAITYPQVTMTEMTGETIKTILEDVCDNLFNPDPYLQQGGDMVRVGGLQYECDPTRTIGSRIKNMTLKGKSIEARKSYKVAGWAPVAEGATGKPIWEIVTRYLREHQVINSLQVNVPRVSGVDGNAGLH